MDTTRITISCVDQTLALISRPLIASGGINVDKVIFTFCSKWTGYLKTAVFYNTTDNVYHVLLDENDSCTIPNEVLKSSGVVHISVFGVDNTGYIRRPSNVLQYTVVDGAVTEATAVPDPTPDIYTQLASAFNKVLDLGGIPGPQGPAGVSGVYVGGGEMPEGYNVRINPNGEACKGAYTIPDYIQQAAEASARTVNNRQTENSFVLAFLADAHCNYSADADNAAIEHASQALSVINKRSPLDLIVHGGDVSAGAKSSTRESTFEDIEDYFELLAGVAGATPEIYVPGNHDDAPYQATDGRLTQRDTVALFGRRNLRYNAVSNGGNYGYIDFASHKIRVIYLDTDDKRGHGTVTVGSSDYTPDYLIAHNVGCNQLKWLAETALDFSDKTNPAEWGIIVVSHVALDVRGSATDAVSSETYMYSTANAGEILGAYRRGKSGSITHESSTINYDYSTLAARAEVYCCIHGHEHAYVERYISSVLSIGCPNVMLGRENVSSDGRTYTKNVGTAEGTAFCVITVDRQYNKIYADHYGAGFDRDWVFVPIAEYTATNQLDVAGYKAGYYLSTGNELTYTSGDMFVSGYIPVKNLDTVFFKNCHIQANQSYHRFSFYNVDKEHLITIKTSSTLALNQVYDDDGYIASIKVFADGIDYTCAYMRFCCSYIGEDSFVAVNEDIL